MIPNFQSQVQQIKKETKAGTFELQAFILITWMFIENGTNRDELTWLHGILGKARVRHCFQQSWYLDSLSWWRRYFLGRYNSNWMLTKQSFKSDSTKSSSKGNNCKESLLILINSGVLFNGRYIPLEYLLLFNSSTNFFNEKYRNWARKLDLICFWTELIVTCGDCQHVMPASDKIIN